jgi:hypothetical protein
LPLLPVLLALAAAPIPAATGSAAPRAADHWKLEVQGATCVAAMRVADGSAFLFSAEAGKVALAVSLPAPVARGSKAMLQTDAWRFDFTPRYGQRDDLVFMDSYLDDALMSALRRAKRARIVIDDQPLAATGLEGAGLGDALDDVIDCSNGYAGWWGPGVKTPA